MRYIAERIRQMPASLVLFSLAPWVAMILFFCASIAPGFQADVQGRVVSRAQWWASGAGVMVTIGAVIFSAQLAAVIFRFKQCRIVIAGAWILFALMELTLGPAITQALTGSSTDSWMLISGTSAFIGVVAYLVATFAPAPRDFLAGAVKNPSQRSPDEMK